MNRLECASHHRSKAFKLRQLKNAQDSTTDPLWYVQRIKVTPAASAIPNSKKASSSCSRGVFFSFGQVETNELWRWWICFSVEDVWGVTSSRDARTGFITANIHGLLKSWRFRHAKFWPQWIMESGLLTEQSKRQFPTSSQCPLGCQKNPHLDTQW